MINIGIALKTSLFLLKQRSGSPQRLSLTGNLAEVTLATGDAIRSGPGECWGRFSHRVEMDRVGEKPLAERSGQLTLSTARRGKAAIASPVPFTQIASKGVGLEAGQLLPIGFVTGARRMGCSARHPSRLAHPGPVSRRQHEVAAREHCRGVTRCAVLFHPPPVPRPPW